MSLICLSNWLVVMSGIHGVTGKFDQSSVDDESQVAIEMKRLSFLPTF